MRVCICTVRALTLKARVPERLAAEALVVLHSIDDDGPSQNVCENKNVRLLQAGSRLQKEKRDKIHFFSPEPVGELVFSFLHVSDGVSVLEMIPGS